MSYTNFKKLFCSQYEFDCCNTCHSNDEFYKTNYLGYEINHCCCTVNDIKADVKKHYEGALENDCQ
jgi:hypothetical protein